ncbi:unnamed protein product, partial [Staurois parvus]
MYVKWCDTDKALGTKLNIFVIFKFPAVPSPVRPNARRGRNPEDRCRHPPDYIAEDTAGGT